MRFGPFFWLGTALAASTVAGLVWSALTGPFSSHDIVRFGFGGLVAVALVWSARASTATRSALKWTALMALLIVAIATALVLPLTDNGVGMRVFGVDFLHVFDGRSEYVPVNEYSVEFFVSVTTAITLVSALFPLWGISARAAARARSGSKPWLLTLIATVPLLREIVARASEGAEVATAIACVSLVWCIVGLRRTTLALRGTTAEPAAA